MTKTLKTTLLEFEKSGFLLDIIETNNKNKYVQIQQTILETQEKHTLKINPTILKNIIGVLVKYEEQLSSKKASTTKNIISNDRQTQIVQRYLKGVAIKDLCLQFNTNTSNIEQILFNNNIEIVDAEKELKKIGQRFWRRRKRK